MQPPNQIRLIRGGCLPQFGTNDQKQNSKSTDDHSTLCDHVWPNCCMLAGSGKSLFFILKRSLFSFRVFKFVGRFRGQESRGGGSDHAFFVGPARSGEDPLGISRYLQLPRGTFTLLLLGETWTGRHVDRQVAGP